MARKGQILSEKTKRKISRTKKKNFSSGKEVSWNKGIPCSEETKIKIREAHKGKHFSPSTEFVKFHISLMCPICKKTTRYGTSTLSRFRFKESHRKLHNLKSRDGSREL